MDAHEISLRPVITILSTLVGAIVGGAALGYGAGAIVAASTGSGSTGGFAALGAALYGSIVGAVAGAVTGILIAFRREPGRVRAITIAAMILAGAALFFGLAGVASQIDDDLVEPPVVWLAVALPGGALIGRWLAVRFDRAGRGG